VGFFVIFEQIPISFRSYQYLKEVSFPEKTVFRSCFSAEFYFLYHNQNSSTFCYASAFRVQSPFKHVHFSQQ